METSFSTMKRQSHRPEEKTNQVIRIFFTSASNISEQKFMHYEDEKTQVTFSKLRLHRPSS